MKINKQITPLPPPPFVIKIPSELGETNKVETNEVCYICFGTEALEKSPCVCQAHCHIPCLLQSIQILPNIQCTICRTIFNSKHLVDYATEIAKEDAISNSLVDDTVGNNRLTVVNALLACCYYTIIIALAIFISVMIYHSMPPRPPPP